MRIRLLLVTAVALLANAANGQIPVPNVVGDQDFEVTDRDVSPPHKITTFNPEVTLMQRIGSELFFVYRGWDDDGTPDKDDNRIYVRRFDLDTLAFDSSVNAMSEAAPEVGSGANYHVLPTILRDDDENLHVFAPCVYQSSGACPEIPPTKIPPHYRRIPDLATPEGWSADPYENGLPLRSDAADLNSKANLYDLSGLYDPSGGVTHLIAEGGNLSNVDEPDVAHSGLHRAYYRFDGAGFDGPYILVEGTSATPAEYTSGGNVFPKGELVLGRETTGQRSLHLAWITDKSFRGGAGCVSAPDVCEVVYDLYYARSDDGGDTWHSLSGESSVSLPEHLLWDGGAEQSDWRVYEGNIAESTERAFTVDANGYPVFAMKKYRAGSDEADEIQVDGATRVNMENPDTEVTPIYDLYLYRWNGTSWIEHLIDDDFNYFIYRPKIHVDRLGRIWIFVASQYHVSSDGGETWSLWQSLPGISAGNPPRIHAMLYPDPDDENYVFLAYPAPSSSHHSRLRFAWLQLTPEVFEATSIASEDGRVIQGLSPGATNATNKAIRMGDTNTNLPERGFLSFDTSPLPEDATISAATLRLQRGFLTYAGTSPLTAFAPASVDAASPYFGGSAALETADFDATGGAPAVAELADDGAVATAILDANGRDEIDLQGKTQFRLRFASATDSDSAWDYVSYYSSETTGSEPTLTVEYWRD